MSKLYMGTEAANEPGQRPAAFGQFLRFAAVGIGVTLLSAGVYWPIATYGNQLFWLGGGAEWPELGGLIAYLAGFFAGNFAHARISFRGHGTRNRGTLRRYFVVQMLGLALNQAFIWILTGPLLHGQTWWPLVPTILITPLITFNLQRSWVYR